MRYDKDLVALVKEYIKTRSLAKTSEKYEGTSSTLGRIIRDAIENGKVPKDLAIEARAILEANNKKKGLKESDVRKALAVYKKYGTIESASEALGITESQMKTRLAAAKRMGIYDPRSAKVTKFKELADDKDKEIKALKEEISSILADPANMLMKDREVVKVKEENKALKKKLKLSEKDVESLRNQVDAMTKLDNRKHKPVKIIPKSGKSESVACMIASDWHIEEPVDPDGLDNYNEFNLEIAEARAKNFFSNGLYLIKKEMQNSKINNVCLGLLGDFISNYIHPELEEEAQLSPTMAIDMAENLVMSGIDFLLNDGCFERLIIPCCFGNHGRTTHKMRFSTGWQNSYEYLMYLHLKKYYENDSRVDVRLTKGYHNVVDFYGHIIRFHHGDAIKGGSGVGGITIPVNRAIHRWNLKEKAALDVFGHFHQMHFQSRFVSNGSLIGYNQFAQRFGCEPEPPRQAFFLIDKDHGRTVCAPIFVDENHHG